MKKDREIKWKKKDNVEKGVSGSRKRRNRRGIMKSVRNLVTEAVKDFVAFQEGDYLFPCYCGLCDLLFSVTRIEDISVGVSKVIDVLKPILYGMVIAYLLNPIVKQIDRWLIPQLKKKMSQEKAKKVSRSVGVFCGAGYARLL